jgi:hypothetical protein
MTVSFALSFDTAEILIEDYIRMKHNFSEKVFTIKIKRDDGEKLFRVEVSEKEGFKL